MIPYIIILLSLLTSFGLTYLIRKIALKKKLTDNPNERSSHTVPTPRLGGLAIIITWFPAISVFYFFNLLEKELYFALLSGILLAIVSFVDDIKSLPPFVRLFTQIITSTLALYFLGGFREFVTYDFFSKINYVPFLYPIIVLGMVWFINLFNFMDGIDGYAANEAISISLILFIFSGGVSNLLLIACILGFIYWNLSKKKIFMGDTGSTQLGFILIVFGIYYHNNYDFSILNWIMIAAPFWFDATYTLYLRWKNKEKLSQAHRKHAYQRLVQAGFSHKKVNLFLVLLNIIIIILIIIYREYDILKFPIMAFTIISIYLIYNKIEKIKPIE